MVQNLLKQSQEQNASSAEGKSQEQTHDMLYDIQLKLSDLSTIEKFQKEIAEMKNQQLKKIAELKESKRNERRLNETNSQLVDRIS